MLPRKTRHVTIYSGLWRKVVIRRYELNGDTFCLHLQPLRRRRRRCYQPTRLHGVTGQNDDDVHIYFTSSSTLHGRTQVFVFPRRKWDNEIRRILRDTAPASRYVSLNEQNGELRGRCGDTIPCWVRTERLSVVEMVGMLAWNPLPVSARHAVSWATFHNTRIQAGLHLDDWTTIQWFLTLFRHWYISSLGI
jgi:hypothetical protein